MKSRYCILLTAAFAVAGLLVVPNASAVSPYDTAYGVQWNFMTGAEGNDARGAFIDVTSDGSVLIQNGAHNSASWGSGTTNSINGGVGAITPLGQVLYGTTMSSLPGMISPGQNYNGGVTAVGNKAYFALYGGQDQYWTDEDGKDRTRGMVWSLDSSGTASIADRHSLSVYADGAGTPRTDPLKPTTTGLTPVEGQNRLTNSAVSSDLNMVMVMDMVAGDFATAGDYGGYFLRNGGVDPAYLPGIGVYNFNTNTLSGPAKQPILTDSNLANGGSNMGVYVSAGIDDDTGRYYGGGYSHSRGESTSDAWDPDGSGPAASIPIVNSTSNSNPAAIGTAYDAAHNLLYAVTWDTTGYDRINNIEPSSDGSNDVFWAGERQDESYIEKRDASGTVVWSDSFDKSPGGGVERVASVDVDANGDLLVVGYFENGGAGGGAEAYDNFVRKYENTAPNDYALLWETDSGLAGFEDLAYDAAHTNNDDTVYLVARTNGQWPNTTNHFWAGGYDLLVQKAIPGDFYDTAAGAAGKDGLVNDDDTQYMIDNMPVDGTGVDTFDFNKDGNSTSADVSYFIANILDMELPSVEGDFTDNGQVEQGDLDLVLLNWGDASDPAPEGWVNDLPTPNNIDQDDLDRVLLNWGNTSALAAADVVPEPASSFLLLIGGLLLGRLRRNG